ncbi:MAG: bifunctional phosphopantothenoylcysteine decarboxylase/phosphopantothenate--cysteine ligase CoaBC [Gammaproteobacteria bacterium]|nr:MAG: bifunctional phosphopantothenoylcysteine decarboxylase/phosphopantothenate--cysteine ligase CoaBC [Gammaproteobacteria bacterium]
MLRLANKRIIVGITGGIAAYKSAELVRRLQDCGAEVRVVMTSAAQAFITPLTLQALSGHAVHLDLLDTDAEAAMGHIELARWGDAIVIAPASADFIARFTHGQGNDLLSTLCLAARCPVAIAPAMNQAMWASAANLGNIETLQTRKVPIFGPADGSQACGDIGPGRMLEPEEIVQQTADLFETRALTGKKVVITAGPTREALDPVRFISNHSSGKMGYALAEAARDAGATVTLISGPVHLNCPDRVSRVAVISAQDMLEASLNALPADIFIATAAVADYRPEHQAVQKIKKQGKGDSVTLTLVENPDIVATIAQQKTRPYVVGFAAETESVVEYARRKIQRKNLDMIVANDVSQTAIGFNSDENAVTAIWADQEQTLERASKSQIASKLIDLIANKLQLSSLAFE